MSSILLKIKGILNPPYSFPVKRWALGDSKSKLSALGRHLPPPENLHGVLREKTPQLSQRCHSSTTLWRGGLKRHWPVAHFVSLLGMPVKPCHWSPQWPCQGRSPGYRAANRAEWDALGMLRPPLAFPFLAAGVIYAVFLQYGKLFTRS